MSTTRPDPLVVEFVDGPVEELLDLSFEEPLRATLRVCRPTAPALVLGSVQPADHVDGHAVGRAGLPVVRRRSGGSAVLVDPGSVVWVDVTLPASDPRWVDDVGRAAWWVGELWAGALGALGVEAPVVHRGALAGDDRRQRVCFAGIGPGEVTVGGRKVVGVAQRRTRDLARFQTMALLRWEGRSTGALVGMDDGCDDVAVGLDVVLGRAVESDEVVAAVIAAAADNPGQPV